MPSAKLKNVGSKLPALGAIALGVGALFAGSAQAERLEAQPIKATPEQSRGSASSANEVAIRIDGNNVYISQNGSLFEQVQLGDTPEAAHLKKLLRDAGADGQSISVPIGATIVASGGGSGKGEKPKEKTSSDKADPAKAK